MHEALHFLAEVEPRTIDRLLTVGVERAVGSGDAIMAQGEPPREILVLLEGVFEVTLEGVEAPIAVLGSGELVGEMSFLEGGAATATVRATEDGRVLALEWSQLEASIQDDARFATDLYRALGRLLARRVRATSQELGSRLAEGSSQLEGLEEWRALAPQLDSFKALLLEVVDGASGTGIVPAKLVERAHGEFDGLVCALSTLLSAEASISVEIERVLNREFLPYLHLSRIVERIFSKPRGYAGDFLTIEWMYGGDVGGVAPIGPLIDTLFLERPSAKAVRNRRGLLAGEIAAVLERGSGKARVTSLAAGPAQELFDVFGQGGADGLSATLIDIDLQALAFVSDRRDSLGLRSKIRLEQGNLVYLATGRRTLDLEGQDLIYSIGLIDYFQDKFVVALLDWIHDCLAPGGKVILGNFHTTNPDRALMEFVLHWKLYHRDEDDMNRIFQASKFAAPCSEIRLEEAGVNLFACGVKAGG
ncbi:MAG: cyclic nucleotide-binding domain-containing protein [bacterium]|nr:cyclic nucleotide-binding domain-containing protein [bacterium]